MMRMFLFIGIIAISLSGFSQELKDGSSNSAGKNANGDPVYSAVEQSPVYPGGDEARIKFLVENINYPKLAREKNIQGTVYATFIVERDGTLSDVRILRGIGGGCDEETIRVIKLMPRWSPGTQRGKPVRVQFNMPIKYTLVDDGKKENHKKKKFKLF